MTGSDTDPDGTPDLVAWDDRESHEKAAYLSAIGLGGLPVVAYLVLISRYTTDVTTWLIDTLGGPAGTLATVVLALTCTISVLLGSMALCALAMTVFERLGWEPPLND